MKNYNILKSTISDRVEPVVQNEIDFWKTYLVLLNTRSDNWITRKEIKVLAWILAQPVNECYFSKPGSHDITEEIENLSFPELSRIKKKLTGLGLVSQEYHDGKIKTLPNKNLRRFQSFVKSKKEINFVFPIMMNEEESTG